MIIKKSIKLSLMLLGIGVIILLTFNWSSEYIDFTSTQSGRRIPYGINLVLIISFLKFIFDFYLIYIKKAHVEITNEGVLDKTSPINESFYAWSEIVNMTVLSGFLCEGLKITYKSHTISNNSSFITNETVTIKELFISDSEKIRIKSFIKLNLIN